MSIYLQLFLIIITLEYVQADDFDVADLSSKEQQADTIHVLMNKGNINQFGKMLAKKCHWTWITSAHNQSVSWDKNYDDCDTALQDINQQYPFVLNGNDLSFKIINDFIWYQPEFLSVLTIKKQLRGWLSAKLIKGFGFFEDSGAIWIPKEKEEFIDMLDIPPKQIHLRAIIWVSDSSEQSHTGLSPNILQAMHYDQLLEHLHLLQSEGLATVLAEPELYLLMLKKAVVSSGEEIPYQTSNDKKTHVSFKKALLSLTVKAQHIGNKGASLDIEISFDKATEQQYHGNVGIARQTVKSSLRIPFNTPFVMGGVRQQRTATRSNCLPVLNKLPIFGSLFCEKNKLDKQSLLYVMLLVDPVINQT